MAHVQHLKPAGGILRVAVVPAGTTAGGSPQEIAAAAVELPLVEGLSSYDEITRVHDGIASVEHLLTIAVPAGCAGASLDPRTQRLWASAGTAAVIDTVSGERIVAGWSERFGSEQPLRLTGIELSTGKTPGVTPAAILTFRSVDTSPAERIQDSEFKIQN